MPLLIVLVAAAAWLFVKGSHAATASSNAAGGVMTSGQGYQSNLDNIAQAIFQFEGGQPGNVNVRNNNPGNLRSGEGMTGTASGYATFGDIGDGWNALGDWISSHAANHPDWDFYDMFDYYLRGKTTGVPTVDAQGNSDQYAEYVSGYLGVDPSTTVSSLLGYNS
jgi:hypothetical protein